MLRLENNFVYLFKAGKKKKKRLLMPESSSWNCIQKQNKSYQKYLQKEQTTCVTETLEPHNMAIFSCWGVCLCVWSSLTLMGRKGRCSCP